MAAALRLTQLFGTTTKGERELKKAFIFDRFERNSEHLLTKYGNNEWLLTAFYQDAVVTNVYVTYNRENVILYMYEGAKEP